MNQTNKDGVKVWLMKVSILHCSQVIVFFRMLLILYINNTAAYKLFWDLFVDSGEDVVKVSLKGGISKPSCAALGNYKWLLLK